MSAEEIFLDAATLADGPGPSVTTDLPAPAAADLPAPAAEAARHASRLPSLTGMRFLAALLVFAFHSSLPLPTIRMIKSEGMWHRYYWGASQAGAFGVTFFFVLSGFVLTWSARPGDTMPGFWRRRFVKIVPNYVLTWAISMAFFAAAVTPAWEAVANLFMLQSWWPNFGVNFSVDTPAWSLGVEAVFYALFPVLLIGAKRIRSAHLKYWRAGIVAAIVGTVALVLRWPAVVASDADPGPQRPGIDGPVLVRLRDADPARA
jgi:peptidoglycan/LPS O-acetylase OafA/YrhL